MECVSNTILIDNRPFPPPDVTLLLLWNQNLDKALHLTAR
jgi:hypothetical protein